MAVLGVGGVLGVVWIERPMEPWMGLAIELYS